jgi:O-acetylserine/cysteine efflux transporter
MGERTQTASRMSARDTVLAVAVAAVWGVSFVPIKWGVMEIPPLMFSAFRFFFAAVPAVLFIAPPRAPARLVIGYGLAIGVAQFGLLFIAINLGMPVGLSSLVMQLHAFFTILLAWLLMGETPMRAQLTGAGIALAGVALIGSQRLGGAALIPFCLTIISAFFWGVGNVIGKTAGQGAERLDMLAFMVWSSLAAPLPLVGLSLLIEGRSGLAALLSPGWFGLACAVFLAYAATLFGFGAWGRLLARYPAAQVAPFALLVPVFGMSSAALIFGEAVSPVEWMGAGLILLGLGWNVMGGRRPGSGGSHENFK